MVHVLVPYVLWLSKTIIKRQMLSTFLVLLNKSPFKLIFEELFIFFIKNEYMKKFPSKWGKIQSATPLAEEEKAYMAKWKTKKITAQKENILLIQYQRFFYFGFSFLVIFPVTRFSSFLLDTTHTHTHPISPIWSILNQ